MAGFDPGLERERHEGSIRKEREEDPGGSEDRGDRGEKTVHDGPQRCASAGSCAGRWTCARRVHVPSTRFLGAKEGST